MAHSSEHYLQHGDYLLALRRLMDHSLDAGDFTALHQAVELSKKYRKALHTAPETVAEAFKLDALAFLAQFNQPIAPASPKVLVAARQVAKTYRRGNFSLKPIDLELQAGQIIGVVGENGNGKTTFMRCLAGQLAPDSGSVHYAGIADNDYYTIKSSVAFIPQRIPRWFGRLRDNLHFSASLSGTTGAQNELLVEFMLERFGLIDYADLNWSQISSGYRTRFEIARVLLMRPQVMILDEPLANLDINAQQTLLTDLGFLTKSTTRPLAVVLTSQQLHEVEKVATRVMLIRNGECIFNSSDKETPARDFALEIETPASREVLQNVLSAITVNIQFNGGYFTLVSNTHTAQQLLKVLVDAGITVSYCRDISNSTKRLF